MKTNIYLQILKLMSFLAGIIFLSGCNLFYFIPPKESVLTLSINGSVSKWTSDGFEAVGDERGIQFYFSKGDIPGLKVDNLIIWLKEPVEPRKFDETNSEIQSYTSGVASLQNHKFFDNSRAKIYINLKKWSSKPRGLIEGDINATVYDFEGKKYEIKGHFKAYQALGTIKSFH